MYAHTVYKKEGIYNEGTFQDTPLQLDRIQDESPTLKRCAVAPQMEMGLLPGNEHAWRFNKDITCITTDGETMLRSDWDPQLEFSLAIRRASLELQERGSLSPVA